MAAVGVAVAQDQLGVGLERPTHGRTDEHATQRLVPRRHALGERDQVGAHVVALGAPPLAQPAEAADDLVEDEERAVLVGLVAQPLEVAVDRRVHAAGAHHRLGDDRRQLGAAVGQHLVELVQAVVGHLHHVADERAEALLVGGQARWRSGRRSSRRGTTACG